MTCLFNKIWHKCWGKERQANKSSICSLHMHFYYKFISVYSTLCFVCFFLRQVLIYCGNPGCLGTRSLDMAGLCSLRSLPLLLLAGVKGGWHCAWLLNLMFLCVINTSSQPEGWEAVILYLLKHNLPSSAMNFVLEYSL